MQRGMIPRLNHFPDTPCIYACIDPPNPPQLIGIYHIYIYMAVPWVVSGFVLYIVQSGSFVTSLRLVDCLVADCGSELERSYRVELAPQAG